MPPLPRVFVSHASRDRFWVEQETVQVQLLEDNGVGTWRCKERIEIADGHTPND